MTRSCCCTPPPQDLVHAPSVKEVQLLTWQSMGHGIGLHTAVFVREGHTLPRFVAAVMTERNDDWMPPPHEAVHALAVVHDDTTQSPGHAFVLQPTVCERAGHAAPPY